MGSEGEAEEANEVGGQGEEVREEGCEAWVELRALPQLMDT